MNPLLCKKKSIFYEVYDIHGVEYKFQGVNVIEKSKNILTVFKINSKNSLYFGGRATLFLLTYECLFNSLHIKFSFPTNKIRRGTAPLLQSSRATKVWTYIRRHTNTIPSASCESKQLPNLLKAFVKRSLTQTFYM